MMLARKLKSGAQDKQSQVTSVYKARSVPAQTLARYVQRAFGSESGFEVSFDEVSNSIVMSGPEKVTAEVTRLLAQIDRQNAEPRASDFGSRVGEADSPQVSPTDARPESTKSSPERRQPRLPDNAFGVERADSPRRIAEQEIPEERAPRNEHIVYSPRTASAQALAETLRNLFDREVGVRIIAEPVSNSLVISRPKP